VPTPADVLVRLGDRATLSHEEAARQLGLPLVDDAGVRRVIVPRSRSRTRIGGWRVHRAELSASEVLHLSDGLRVTSHLRTVTDLARVLPVPEAVAAADAALRDGHMTVTALGGLVSAARGYGSGGCRRVAALLDPLAGSIFESLLRVVLVLGGVPAPVSQHQVRDANGRVVARVDLCWPAARLIVEADGYAFHSDRLAYRRDRERMNELERLGWRVLRITWEDVRQRPLGVVELVTECLTQGAA